jgi:hypothetical protein
MHTRTVALAAVVASLILATVGASTASAAAANLTLTPTSTPNLYRATVSGFVSNYYPRGADIAVRLWGEDEWYDDLLVGPVGGTLDGDFLPGPFTISFNVSGSTLNEDKGARDELYAGVRIYNHSTGQQVQTAETNRLYGYWS